MHSRRMSSLAILQVTTTPLHPREALISSVSLATSSCISTPLFPRPRRRMLAYLSSPFYLRQPKPSPSGWAERIHQQANETRMVSHLRWHRRQYCCHQPEMKQYVVDALRAGAHLAGLSILASACDNHISRPQGFVSFRAQTGLRFRADQLCSC